jgi:hypothetical protein
MQIPVRSCASGGHSPRRSATARQRPPLEARREQRRFAAVVVAAIALPGGGGRFETHIVLGDEFNEFYFSVRKLPPGMLRSFAPRKDDPARSEAVGGRERSRRNKGAPSKPLSKLLQNQRVSLQAFPNISLAVLWYFNGLQGFQTAIDGVQVFRSRPPLFGRILAYFAIQFSGQRVYRGAATPDRENFEPNRQSGFWEEISVISSPEPSFAGSGPASGRSPWMKRAFRFSVHSRRFRRTNRLHHLSFSSRHLSSKINIITAVVSSFPWLDDYAVVERCKAPAIGHSTIFSFAGFRSKE